MISNFDTASLQLSKARAVLACAVDRYDQGDGGEDVSLLVETAHDLLVECDTYFQHCVMTCERCPKGSEIE